MNHILRNLPIPTLGHSSVFGSHYESLAAASASLDIIVGRGKGCVNSLQGNLHLGIHVDNALVAFVVRLDVVGTNESETVLPILQPFRNHENAHDMSGNFSVCCRPPYLSAVDYCCHATLAQKEGLGRSSPVKAGESSPSDHFLGTRPSWGHLRRLDSRESCRRFAEAIAR